MASAPSIGITEPKSVFHRSGPLCADLADMFKAIYGERHQARYGEWPMLTNLICAAGTDSPSLGSDGWYIKACQTIDGVDIEAGEDPAQAVTVNDSGYLRRS